MPSLGAAEKKKIYDHVVVELIQIERTDLILNTFKREGYDTDPSSLLNLTND